MHDLSKVVTGGSLAFCAAIILGGIVYICHVSGTAWDYQQKALNNGLAITVVEMKQTGKYSAKTLQIS